MPASQSDSDSRCDSDDNIESQYRKQHPPASPSSDDDDSGAEGDEESDNEQEEIILVNQDQAMWTIEELEILSSFKDEWIESGTDQRGAIVENAVKRVISLRKQDPGPLRKKIRTWLRRKVKKRKAFGPGRSPSLHTIVAWYHDAELNRRVKDNHGVVPGDKGRFIGLWKTELTAMVNDLKENPLKRKELQKMEDKRAAWMAKGPPPDRRKWTAEKKALEMVKNFVYDMYWETGARLVVTIGYRNTKNTVCVGQFDWNQYLGKNGKNFVEQEGVSASAFLDKFKDYAEKHLTGDEADPIGDISIPKGPKKLSKLKPDLPFTRNSRQEPLLPADSLDQKLEDKKHIFRCFLKAQYGLAKGSQYPGSQCTPPWAKLGEVPDKFFDPDDVPEVDYDGDRTRVTLQDPSRMKIHELNACLRFWQDRQKENKPSFQFHHWWSEARKRYEPAHEPQPLDSDPDEDSAVPTTLAKNHQGKGPTKRKKIKDGKKTKTECQPKDHSVGDDPTGAPVQCPSQPMEYNEVPSTPGPFSDHEHTPSLGNQLDNLESHLANNTTQSRSAQALPNPSSPPTPIPIDPILTGFPTQGPNDHVPQGFHPIPYSMIPSQGSSHTLLGQFNPNAAISSPSPLPIALLPSSDPPLTIETLAQMVMSLQARLTLQERPQSSETHAPQHHGEHEVNKPTTEEQLTVPTRPRTWPDRATPIQTRRKATEIAGDAKLATGENVVDDGGPFQASAHEGRRQKKRSKSSSQVVPSDDKNGNQPMSPRKRTAEEAAIHPNSKKPSSKKVRFSNEEDHLGDKPKVVQPRPMTRGARKQVADEDDHFRRRRSRRHA